MVGLFVGGLGVTKKSWIKRHINDPYVQQSQKDGYPSRAAYKLLALQESYKLLRPGMSVIDLGAAPGGWTAVAAKIVGPKGKVVALDLLPVQGGTNIKVITGDCFDEEVGEKLKESLPSGADMVMSDMAPNFSGHRSVDQPRSMALVEMAATLASEHLKEGGTFLAKIFQGEGADTFLRSLRKDYKKVMMRKPPASRSTSREFYVLATNFVGYNDLTN